MRSVHLLTSLLTLAAVALLAGCGGGKTGGGGGGGADYGLVTINTTTKLASYTPPAKVSVNFVYANFTSASKATTVTIKNIPFYEHQLRTWELDLSSKNTDIKQTAQGNFDMAVYAWVPDEIDPVQIGPLYRVSLNITGSGGGGPPPPPF